MMLASLVVVTLCTWTTDPDPAVLVARLSSPSNAEREAAAGSLEELGRPALPALYRARDTAHGNLAQAIDRLTDLIERQRLLRATKVKLDFEERPLVEVVASLRDRTGFPPGHPARPGTGGILGGGRPAGDDSRPAS